MKEYIIIIAILLLTTAGALWAVNGRVVPMPSKACTEEAKICPDGSAVGRTGPNCEFEACPVSNDPVELEAKIGEKVSGLGVSITPLAVLEDSRCPADVTCIWEGRVRLSAQLESGLGVASQEFTLNEPITTEAEEVTLVAVLPTPLEGVAPKEGAYTFRFIISKR